MTTQKDYRQQKSEILKVFKVEKMKPANVTKSAKEIWRDLKFWSDQLNRNLSTREIQQVRNLSELLRNVDFLYGDKSLFQEYLNAREIILNKKPFNTHIPQCKTRREEIVFSLFLTDVKKYEIHPDNFLKTGKLGPKIDLKRNLYRIPEQIITNLGFFYKAKSQNTVEITKELVERKVMDEKLGKKVQGLLNFVMGKNLKQQVILKKQNFEIYVSKKKFKEDKKEIAKNIGGLEQYIELAEKAGNPFSISDEEYSKLSAMKQKLKEIEKIAPEKILSIDEVKLINHKYLPRIIDLYTRVIGWLSGDMNAFSNPYISKKEKEHKTKLLEVKANWN
jgi:hypothetical protein